MEGGHSDSGLNRDQTQRHYRDVYTSRSNSNICIPCHGLHTHPGPRRFTLHVEGGCEERHQSSMREEGRRKTSIQPEHGYGGCLRGGVNALEGRGGDRQHTYRSYLLLDHRDRLDRRTGPVPLYDRSRRAPDCQTGTRRGWPSRTMRPSANRPPPTCLNAHRPAPPMAMIRNSSRD